MTPQQPVRQLFRFSSFILLPCSTSCYMVRSLVCIWKSLALSSSVLSQEFESEPSDSLELLLLLIANSNYSVRWAFESSFSLNTVTRNL